MNAPSGDEFIAGHLQELRRGTVVLACLVRLRRPDYGYALLESLEDVGVSTDANTLYPLLRRLEKQGLLISEWNTDEARPRKFYRTSAAGDAVAQVLIEDWERLDGAIRGIARTGAGAGPGPGPGPGTNANANANATTDTDSRGGTP